MDFKAFFQTATGFPRPYQWQQLAAERGLPELLPVSTGLGKTEGAVLAWAWRRLILQDLDEPRHLIYCLPMRTLVRQTVDRLNACFDVLAAPGTLPRIAVYTLMGGDIDDEWVKDPEKAWVLVGTQDQLLSRALNRGYAMRRFDWPIHFGLLNQDCRWIIDEVQLMGPGLWTTAQLDWMRRKRFLTVRPCKTTWMSATIGTSFLRTTDRNNAGIDSVAPMALLADDDNEEWQTRRAALRRIEWLVPKAGKKADTLERQIAAVVHERHCAGTVSLVVCNKVATAQAVFAALPEDAPKILLTSRFRPNDRKAAEARLIEFELRRSRCARGLGGGELTDDDRPGLICVSTQVIEAGLDISARRLWSELPPWPSLIQRLGRLNRDGRDDDAQAWFWKTPKDQERRSADSVVRAGPYPKSELVDAATLLDAIIPYTATRPFEKAVAALETSHGDLLKRVLQPTPQPMPRALDVYGLFSTERDVHGGFTDISAFVRNADPEADLTVFWRTWNGSAPPRWDDLTGPAFEPQHEGCPVAFHHLASMLQSRHAQAWLWDDEDGAWAPCRAGELRPGMVLMLHRDRGGYDKRLGWTGEKAHMLDDVPPAGRGAALQDDRRTEIGYWTTLPAHLADARREAEQLCDALGLEKGATATASLRSAVIAAASWHDIGKAHPKWQSALPPDRPTAQGLWAKSQREEIPFRPGLRHEAASALAMWRRYQEVGTDYPALAVYLAAAHHGKVRTVLRSTRQGGNDVFGVTTDSAALQIGDEMWPLDFNVAHDGAVGEWREGGFAISGHGWTGLVADLLGPWRDGDLTDVGAVPLDEPRHLGPLVLAWLEALVRIADWRASERPSEAIIVGEAADAA